MIPSRSLESDDLLAAPAEGRLRTIVIGPVKVDRDEIGTAGGGGPVRAVAEALTDSGIPACTAALGHLLAHNLVLTVDDPAHSIHLALRGNARKIDVGVVEKRTKTPRNGSDGSPALARSRAQRQTGRNQVSDMVLTAEATAQTLIIGNRGQGLNHARRSFCCGCCRSPGLKPRP